MATAAIANPNPQRGVKRALTGPPTGVPAQLPGFRGHVIDAGAAVKVPRLRNGNLNNRTSNAVIPYSRVADARVLAPGSGPLAPGDVAFVCRTPCGFHPDRGNWPSGGTQTLSSVLGLDGLNAHLAGKGMAGLLLDWNVMDLGTDGAPSAVLPDARDGRFKLALLDAYRLDGVVISSEFAHSTRSDDCVLNVAVQGDGRHALPTRCPLRPTAHARTAALPCAGPTPLNNGFRAFDAHALPPNAQAYRRDLSNDYIGRVHEAAIDAFPTTMWDRKVVHRDSLYLCLRAVYLTTKEKLVVRDASNAPLFADAATAEARCLVKYQYMPCSARACHEIVATAAARAAAPVARPPKPPPPFTAITEVDYAHFLGAWLVGSVMDSAAATREVRRDTPRNASFSVMLNTQIEWRNGLPVSEVRAVHFGRLLKPNPFPQLGGAVLTVAFF